MTQDEFRWALQHYLSRIPSSGPAHMAWIGVLEATTRQHEPTFQPREDDDGLMRNFWITFEEIPESAYAELIAAAMLLAGSEPVT